MMENNRFEEPAGKIFRFENPTQVKFLDFDSEDLHWIGGIAYGSSIICGCCGGIFEIADIWIDWENSKTDPIYADVESPIEIFENWVDINEEIIGE